MTIGSRGEGQERGAPRSGAARRLLEQARRARQAGDRQAAQAAYEQALAADSSAQEAWLGLAELATDPLFARALCERILQKWPGCPDAQRILRRLGSQAGERTPTPPRDEEDGVPEAAVRAGAPLYRGSQGKGGDTPAWADLDLSGGDWRGQETDEPPRAAARPTPGTGPWLSLALIVTLLAFSIGATLLWRRAARPPQDGAAAETPAAATSASSEEGDLALQAAPPSALGLERLCFWPADRWIEIVPSQGRLTVYEGRRPVRSLAAGGLHVRPAPEAEAASAARNGLGDGEARLMLPGAPWRSPAGEDEAWYYALDIARGDAWWLAGWLPAPGPISGRLYLSAGRILIALD